MRAFTETRQTGTVKPPGKSWHGSTAMISISRGRSESSLKCSGDIPTWNGSSECQPGIGKVPELFQSTVMRRFISPLLSGGDGTGAIYLDVSSKNPYFGAEASMKESVATRCSGNTVMQGIFTSGEDLPKSRRSEPLPLHWDALPSAKINSHRRSNRNMRRSAASSPVQRAGRHLVTYSTASWVKSSTEGRYPPSTSQSGCWKKNGWPEPTSRDIGLNCRRRHFWEADKLRTL